MIGDVHTYAKKLILDKNYKTCIDKSNNTKNPTKYSTKMKINKKKTQLNESQSLLHDLTKKNRTITVQSHKSGT